ncbi:putative Phosphatidylinositol transfer protein [Plasmodium knowlesi]|uniref:Putative Phosphatidylinositol transfer protein n=1 Tax=Plasmodium knowlesi TaxID=5850 RepID=A0A1Y3DSY1_PLAKN|nr:putative Phosphatidylinositol transfer protein [Plasmodium knowlesi]
MKLIEFRLAMPLSMEEYNICHRHLLAKVTEEDTTNTINGVGKNNRMDVRKVVLFKKGTVHDENGKPVDYTFKRLNLVNKIPKWIQNFVDPKYCLVDEKSWSVDLNSKVLYEAKGFPKACVKIESTCHIGHNTEDNVFNLSDELLAQRKVVLIDIVNDKIPPGEYRTEEDPTIFYSEKAQRGRLEENWIENSKVIITCYKLFSIDIPYFGVLCSRFENWIVNIIKNSLLKYHRRALCQIDEWYNLTEKGIHMFEADLQEQLENFWKEVGLDVENDSTLAVQYMAKQQPRVASDQYVNNCGNGDDKLMDDGSRDSIKNGSSDGDSTYASSSQISKDNMNFPSIETGSLSEGQVEEKVKEDFDPFGSEGNHVAGGEHNTKVAGVDISTEAGEGSETSDSSRLNVNEEPYEHEEEPTGDFKLGEDDGSEEVVEEGHEKMEKTKSSKSSNGKWLKDDIMQEESVKLLTSTTEVGLTEAGEEAEKNRMPATPGVTKMRGRMLREVNKIDEDMLITENEEEAGEADDSDTMAEKNLSKDVLEMGAETKANLTSAYKSGDQADDEYTTYEHTVNEGEENPWKLHYIFVTKNKMSSTEGGIMNPFSTEKGLKNMNVQRIEKFKGGDDLLMLNPITKRMKMINYENEIWMREAMIDTSNNGEGVNDMFFSRRDKYLWEERGTGHLFTPTDMKNFYADQGGGRLEWVFSSRQSVSYKGGDGILNSYNAVNSVTEDSQMINNFAQHMESIHNYNTDDMSRKDSNTSLALFYVMALVFFVYSSMSIHKRFKSLFYFLLSALMCVCAFLYYEYWNHSWFYQGNVYKFSMSSPPGSINSVTSFLDVQKKQNSQEEFYKNFYNTLSELNKSTVNVNFASKSLNGQFQSTILNNIHDIFLRENVKYSHCADNL